MLKRVTNPLSVHMPCTDRSRNNPPVVVPQLGDRVVGLACRLRSVHSIGQTKSPVEVLSYWVWGGAAKNGKEILGVRPPERSGGGAEAFSNAYAEG